MKKLELNLDTLKVDTFHTEGGETPNGTVFGYVTQYYECGGGTNDAQCWAGTHGGHTCDTTCHQIICGCSVYPTDCDYTCPGYVNAEYFSCFDDCE
jgi:hypothetical protein